MKKMGYDEKLSLGAIAISGTLSVPIPPSVILIVYAGWQDVSVARLFAGGIIPGILMALLLVLTVTVLVIRNPKLAPVSEKTTFAEGLKAFLDILPYIGIIFLVLGSIFGGIMTPTESAALGALISIIMAIIYRKLTLQAFLSSMWTAVTITSMIAFVLFTARMLGQLFQFIGLTEVFADFMLGLPFGRYGILLINASCIYCSGVFLTPSPCSF